MKKQFLGSLFGLLCVALTAGYFVSITTEPSRARKALKKVQKSIRSIDDPFARWNYELMMVRDPQTGSLPPDIRKKEQAFADNLPTRESMMSLGKRGSSMAATWTSRGPFNVGGRTRGLAFDISNPSILLAGGVSGGMWRSTNGGSSWSRTTGLSDHTQSVTCLAQDSRSGKTNAWYYGTGEFRGNSASGGGSGFYHGDGIFKSTDGGISWNVLSSTISNTPQSWDGDFDYVWNIVTDPSNASQDEVYAAVYGGIKRSTNGGTSWVNALTADAGLVSGNFTDVAITSTGVVYATISSDASTQDGIFRSTDGVTWTPITPTAQGFPSTFNRIVIGIAPSNQNIVYFLAETPGSGVQGHSLWMYDASGNGWINRSTNIPSFGDPVGNFDSQSSYDLVIEVKPDNQNVVLIGGTNLYRSTDGFATAQNVAWIGGYSTANNISQYANQHPDQHSLVFDPTNANILLAGHDGGISKTTNILATAVTWTVLNNGYLTTQFYTLAVDQGTSGNPVVIGGMQDNGTWFVNSTGGTASWTDIWSGDGAYCAVVNGRSAYYVSSQNGSTYTLVLSNNGTLTDYANVTPANATGFLFINPFILDPNDNTKMYMAAGGTIWRNNNLNAIPRFSSVGQNAGNKTTVNWDSLTTSTITSGRITSLAVSRTPANRLYYGTSTGQVFKIENANTGMFPTRSTITGASFPTNGYVSCIAVDPTNADRVMAIISNYSVQSIFSSTDGGISWAAVGGNLEQFANGTGNGPSVRWATIVPGGSATTYFVGTSVGAYSTTALNGASTVWVQEGASVIGKVVVPMVISRPSDGLVIAGTHANGAFTATVSAPSIVEQLDGAVPQEFRLEQNYPNPFNPSTTIRYSLAREARVRLTIVNSAGQEVVRLADEVQSAGTYSAEWNGKDRQGFAVASGMYLCRLESAGFRQTRKMALVR